MDFLLSLFNTGKIMKGEGEIKKKKKNPTLEPFFVLFMQGLLCDYFVVIYKMNNILNRILTK